MVAPAVWPDAASSATTSAWLSPGGWVIPSPMMRPSFTTTAPTIGFGLVWPRARSASSIALRRCRVSCSVTAIEGIVDSAINDTSGPERTRLAFRRVQRVLLGLILVAGFALRVWHNDYGLPFVYSIDEASHFTSRAVEMFWQDLDPGYYQNPATYTYIVFGTLRVLYGPLGFLFGLPYGNVTTQFDKDPAQIWIIARTLAAVLCTAGVAATYAAARRLWGTREGLVAAAVMAFAFLPVAYSRVAVTDVGALMGVALALMWSARAADEGRTLDFVLAGAAAGLAIAFKYTAGLVLLPLAIAAVARLRVDGARPLAGLALAGRAAVGGCAVLAPYLLG